MLHILEKFGKFSLQQIRQVFLPNFFHTIPKLAEFSESDLPNLTFFGRIFWVQKFGKKFGPPQMGPCETNMGPIWAP